MTPHSHEPLPETLEFTLADEGNKVTVTSGDIFELRLPEDPDSGERWGFLEHAGVVILEDHHDDAAHQGERVFRLQVLGDQSYIVLQRAQVFDPLGPPGETFVLHLVAE
jgi:predicted secreted protein